MSDLVKVPTYMPWRLSHRVDPHARTIADRHYNRQKIGYTAGGLVALQLLPDQMPDPAEPEGAQGDLFASPPVSA